MTKLGFKQTPEHIQSRLDSAAANRKSKRPPAPGLVANSNDLYWLAGLIEGEGYIGWNTVRGKHHPRIVVNMSDEDVIRKAHQIARGGRVSGPYQPRPQHHSPMWRWVADGPAAINLMKDIQPLLCSRRSSRIDEVLTVAEADRLESQQARRDAINRNRAIMPRDGKGRFIRNRSGGNAEQSTQ